MRAEYTFMTEWTRSAKPGQGCALRGVELRRGEVGGETGVWAWTMGREAAVRVIVMVLLVWVLVLRRVCSVAVRQMGLAVCG